MALRILHVTGTHREIGLQVGRTFRRQIQDFLQKYDKFRTLLLPFLDSTEGRKVYEGYLKVAQSVYPQYMEEVQGTAEGAEVSFEHLFLLHCRPEILLMLKSKQENVDETSGCTSVFLNFCNGPRLLAHNEDADANVQKLGYIVVANVKPYQLPNGDVLPEENFTSFCYPGILPGVAYAYNSHGVCFSTNAQLAKSLKSDRIVRHFMNRALLTASSVEHAVDILKNTPVGVALGFCSNLATLHGDRGRMYSIECAPTEGESSGTLVSVRGIEQAEKGSVGHYYHYNMYDHLDTPQWRTPSSQHRKARADEMEAAKTVQDVLNFLGDTKDPDYPVYRTGTMKDLVITATTAVFDLEAGELEIYTGNPKTQPEPDCVFHLCA
ncbi:beta-alanyl-dopamine/carcinine hydrolase-like [Branchiostoma lanceolatum]|uniref:beta-alanyl-dopamine/carcinine hydrolase-like n=1 Tax=Branchiostoma lanceolatum TaxID=7740 RepID=UPI003451ABA2